MIHRVQHILAFFAYSLATFFWVFIKDYKNFMKPNIGPYNNKNHPLSKWIILFVTKGIYYTYMLIFPMLLLEITWVHFLIGFVTLHLSAGLILGIIFQLAHAVEETGHPLPDEENMIDEHWMIHEMVTTNNFARDNKALCWFVGGLNFQIEHHLFPKVCSVHYPAISPIVEKPPGNLISPITTMKPLPKQSPLITGQLKNSGIRVSSTLTPELPKMRWQRKKIVS